MESGLQHGRRMDWVVQDCPSFGSCYEAQPVRARLDSEELRTEKTGASSESSLFACRRKLRRQHRNREVGLPASILGYPARVSSCVLYAGARTSSDNGTKLRIPDSLAFVVATPEPLGFTQMALSLLVAITPSNVIEDKRFCRLWISLHDRGSRSCLSGPF